MERKEFLSLCQKNAMFPKSAVVKFGDMVFFPVGYKITFADNGKPLHTAILRDRKANSSFVYCNLEKVE